MSAPVATEFVPVCHVFATVKKYLSERPKQWVTAREVQDAIPEAMRGQFTLAAIGAEMGALHDYGMVTTFGTAGEADRQARWDAG